MEKRNPRSAGSCSSIKQNPSQIETSGMSVAVLKSYFAFFQRGTGVILADDPWRVFIELGKNI